MFIQLKLLSIYIFLLDSMFGIIEGNSNLSNYMILLTSIIIPISLLTSNSKIMNNLIYILGLILIISFSTYNILIWYVSFEIILIPMILILTKGSSSLISRYRAIYRFVLYTILGGILLLFSLLIIIITIGSYNYESMILTNSISILLQIILFPIALTAYLIKLPIIPFHIWLPDTHSESPTAGSVILAALLLKLGGIGIIRWLIPILPYGYLYYKPILLILGAISSIYASITTLRHIDIKKLIAYSSIAHMGFILIGLGSYSKLTLINYQGVLLLLVSHGLVSSLLFLLIGSLYVRTGTRYLMYYRGLAQTMPIFSIIWFITLLLNAAFPPSLSFFAEFLILQGTSSSGELFITINLLLSVLLSGIYSIILFCKVSYNTPWFNYSYSDITFKEFSICLPLIILSIILGPIIM